MREFRGFRLDEVNQWLWRRDAEGNDERVQLRPKPFAMLRYLVDHAGRLVTQDELLDAVWPDAHVQPEVLKRHMLDIRGALGDDAKSPIFIATHARRGYEFIAQVGQETSRHIPPASSPKEPFVGRQIPSGQLRSMLQRALKGERQIVFITGDAGIGKTRLVDEFQETIQPDAVPWRARGQCVEGFGGVEAYYPVLESIGNLCRGPEGDRFVDVLASHAPAWMAEFPALIGPGQREQLRHEPLGATPDRMMREIGEALEVLTASSPLLLIIEDLQWADPSTIDLISALARGTAPAKLMLIVTCRSAGMMPAEQPLLRLKHDLLAQKLCREIELLPLEEKDVEEYIAGDLETGADAGLAVRPDNLLAFQPHASAWGSHWNPHKPQADAWGFRRASLSRWKPTIHPAEALAALIHRHSGGNPLFMVAALEHMARRDPSIPLEEIDREVAETLRTMIEGQIELLSPEQQRILEAASVIGITFSARSAAVAADVRHDTTEAVLEDLTRRRMMVRRTVESSSYEFAHALCRQVFYRRQTHARVSRVRIRIAERLEEFHANELDCRSARCETTRIKIAAATGS